jgi:TM2 domain-containing membrane protein YozV
VSDQRTPDLSVPPPGAAAGSFGPPVPAAPPAPVKSPSTAVLLSLLFTGAGHWYTGDVARGFAFLGGAVLAVVFLGYVIGMIAVLAVAIWAAIDAGRCAERRNA